MSGTIESQRETLTIRDRKNDNDSVTNIRKNTKHFLNFKL